MLGDREWLIGSFFALFLGCGLLSLVMVGVWPLAVLVLALLSLLWWDVSQ